MNNDDVVLSDYHFSEAMKLYAEEYDIDEGKLYEKAIEKISDIIEELKSE